MQFLAHLSSAFSLILIYWGLLWGLWNKRSIGSVTLLLIGAGMLLFGLNLGD